LPARNVIQALFIHFNPFSRFCGLVRIHCPNGVVAAARSAHHGKSHCAEKCRDQNPNMVKGQRRKIRNSDPSGAAG
jgi:hypothetical protein